MKSTESFKKTIQGYLEKRSAEDELFAASFTKPGKTIDDCVTYILNTVKASGCNGFSDEEIFGMAVHYYDEDKIEVGKPVSGGSVVVNHHVELTEEEKNSARVLALKNFEEQQLKELQKQQALQEEKEKKKQTRLERIEAERKTKKAEAHEKLVMVQPALF